MPLVCIIISFFLISYNTHLVAKTSPEVVFVSDELASNENLTGASLVIEKLRHVLLGKLQFVYVKASRKREWRELSLHQNVCLFNKIKTPERESNAFFTSLPIQIFPPNQLITIDKPALPESITIQEAIEQYDLDIAVQAGRSYGEETDNLLKDYADSITYVEGLNSTARIMKMMINGRVDAIVEYPTVIATNLTDWGQEHLLERINAYHILGGAGFAYGFIACSKTAEGKEIVEILDNALTLEDVQDMMVELNISYFPDISHRSIINEWRSLQVKTGLY